MYFSLYETNIRFQLRVDGLLLVSENRQNYFSTQFIQSKVQVSIAAREFSVVIPRINRNLTSASRREKREEEEYAVLSYQFVSSVFGISDKFEARSLKIPFLGSASSAHESCANSLEGKEMFGKCRGGLRAPRDVLTVRFEIPFVTHTNPFPTRGVA